jgi:hypothetical protein
LKFFITGQNFKLVPLIEDATSHAMDTLFSERLTPATYQYAPRFEGFFPFKWIHLAMGLVHWYGKTLKYVIVPGVFA